MIRIPLTSMMYCRNYSSRYAAATGFINLGKYAAEDVAMAFISHSVFYVEGMCHHMLQKLQRTVWSIKLKLMMLFK
jgi:hypothetical protein